MACAKAAIKRDNGCYVNLGKTCVRKILSDDKFSKSYFVSISISLQCTGEFTGISFPGRPAKKNRSRSPKKEKERERDGGRMCMILGNNNTTTARHCLASFAWVCVCCPPSSPSLLCAFFFCRIFANVFFSSSSSPHPADEERAIKRERKVHSRKPDVGGERERTGKFNGR